MIVLGIDPGSLTTGYGLITAQANRLKLCETGPIRLKKHGDIPQRLAVLHSQLTAIVEKHRPQVLAIEKVFHGLNFNATIKLGYVRGVILMTAAQMGLQVAEYSATQVKKAVTGYGRAEKQQVQEMVRILLNLREVPKPHDAADALAIAICHAHMGPVMEKFNR